MIQANLTGLFPPGGGGVAGQKLGELNMKLAFVLLCFAFLLQDAVLISLHLKFLNLRRRVRWMEEEVGLLLDGYSEDA